MIQRLLSSHCSLSTRLSAQIAASTEALREELRKLRFSALYKRAVSEDLAIEQSALDDALDSDDPRSALINLLVTAAEQRQLEERRHVLRQLKISALHVQALNEGVDQARVDEAMDNTNPREALITVLLDSAAQTSIRHRPAPPSLHSSAGPPSVQQRRPHAGEPYRNELDTRERQWLPPSFSRTDPAPAPPAVQRVAAAAASSGRRVARPVRTEAWVRDTGFVLQAQRLGADVGSGSGTENYMAQPEEAAGLDSMREGGGGYGGSNNGDGISVSSRGEAVSASASATASTAVSRRLIHLAGWSQLEDFLQGAETTLARTASKLDVDLAAKAQTTTDGPTKTASTMMDQEKMHQSGGARTQRYRQQNDQHDHHHHEPMQQPIGCASSFSNTVIAEADHRRQDEIPSTAEYGQPERTVRESESERTFSLQYADEVEVDRTHQPLRAVGGANTLIHSSPAEVLKMHVAEEEESQHHQQQQQEEFRQPGDDTGLLQIDSATAHSVTSALETSPAGVGDSLVVHGG
eukprot:COSAG02_NODE_8786_length_2448_cov_1.467433_1_plen_521_part_10